jgi:NAD-dependent dihydropyrimidine dehydrogenase PreA subunit
MRGFRYLPDVATLKLDAAKCNGCRTCEIVCPHRVLVVEDRKARIADLDACMECGACMVNCPQGALTVHAGVGCASAIIGSWFGRRSEPSCGSDAGTDGPAGACGC